MPRSSYLMQQCHSSEYARFLELSAIFEAQNFSQYVNQVKKPSTQKTGRAVSGQLPAPLAQMRPIAEIGMDIISVRNDILVEIIYPKALQDAFKNGKFLFDYKGEIRAFKLGFKGNQYISSTLVKASKGILAEKRMAAKPFTIAGKVLNIASLGLGVYDVATKRDCESTANLVLTGAQLLGAVPLGLVITGASIVFKYSGAQDYAIDKVCKGIRSLSKYKSHSIEKPLLRNRNYKINR